MTTKPPKQNAPPVGSWSFQFVDGEAGHLRFMEALVAYCFPQVGDPRGLSLPDLAYWYQQTQLLKKTGHLYNGPPAGY